MGHCVKNIKLISNLLTITLLVIVFGNSFAQENSTGVFLTMKPGKNYKGFAKKVSTRDHNKSSTVYIPLQPIISGEEFTRVSEISNDIKHNESYFYLSFSKEGIDKLNDIATKVTGAEMVLVVNNTIIGNIKAVRAIVNQSIQINGPLNSPDVLWAYFNLKELIDSRK